MEYFSYNNYNYPIIIVKKNNKNSYIRVRDKQVIITTNYFISNKYLKNIINDNYDSIVKMIDKMEKRKINEDVFALFGKEYNVISGSFSGISIVDNNIFVPEIKDLKKYVDNLIEKTFQERLDYWVSIYEESIPKPNLKIRTMKSRWGVCNIRNNNITLNRLLYKYKIECLDYVIVHELSHFIHPNHSKDFWKQVAKYYPNYKEIRKLLREN